MSFAPEFFTLNLRFAEKVVAVSDQTFAQALFNYTHLYLSLGLGRGFDPEHPLWQEFLRGVAAAEDKTSYTHAFHLQHAPPKEMPNPAFGCFSYAVWEGGRIRLHFHNAEAAGVSPLARERVPQRVAELRELFTHVGEHVPHAGAVVGGSWLYNLEAYHRLFPPAFIATARPSYADFQFSAMWGQFMDRAGGVRAQLAEKFLARLEQAANLAEVKSSFPYPMLRLESAIEAFYTWYDLR